MIPRCRPRCRPRLLIKDEADGGRAYRSRVFPVVAQYGGKYLVIGGPIDSVEATWRPAFPVLFELAHGWYNSEEYRDLKELRLGGNEGSRCFHGWRGDLGLPGSHNLDPQVSSHTQSEVRASSCGCGTIVLD